MAHTVTDGDKIVERGEELYHQRIRIEVEKPENIGKMVIIDVVTGDYAVDDNGLIAAHLLQAKHPDVALYDIRIGYKASEALGGILERTYS